MLSYSDKLKEIKIRYVLLIFVLVYAIIIMFAFFDIWISEDLPYILVTAYILYNLKDYFKKIKHDVGHIFEKIDFKTVFAILVFNIIFSLAMVYVCNLLIEFFPVLDEFFMGADYSASGLIEWLFLFISLVIVPPVCEEFIFRGVLFNRLSTKMSLTLAAILSSFIFGLMHGLGSITGAFVFGLCMCALYIKTDNIFVPMLVHFLNNLICVLMDYIPNIDVFFSSDIVAIAFMVLGVVSLVCILIFLKNEFS